MAIEGKVIPPNTIDDIVLKGRATQDFAGFLNNVSKTITISGEGTPESVVEAPKRTLYIDETAAGLGNAYLYFKSTESGKTGWKLHP